MIDADVLVVATPWLEFSNISVNKIQQLMRGNIIVDPYAVLDGVNLKSSGYIYYSLGSYHQSSDPK
jgi:predicted dinucleotide-binding enzyme